MTERELTRELRQAGLRVTRPRLLILGLMHELGGHRSADELLGALEREGTALPRASVYGIVDALTRAGLLTRADAGPGRALYETSKGRHHHFVCVDCEEVLDVPCRGSEESPCLGGEAEVGEVRDAQVILRGVCHGCAAGPEG